MKSSTHASQPVHVTQQGLSLVEVMVALAIASIVGIGLTQIFVSTKQAFNTNTALARAQENSRFALEFLSHDLRMVGHLGTRNEQGASPGAVEDPFATLLFNHLAEPTARTPASAQWLYRLDIPFQVFEFTGTGMGATLALPETPVAALGGNEWSPALDADLADALIGTALRGSDVVVMRSLSADFVTLVNSDTRPDGMVISTNVPFDPGTGTFFYQAGIDPNFILPGGIYAFSNVSAISLFQVTAADTPTSAGEEVSATAAGGLNNMDWMANVPVGAPGPGGTSEQENPSNYGSMLPVHRYDVAVYYVALGADGGPSLFRRRLVLGALGDAEELVPGVESMQAVLGVANTAFPRNSDQPTAYVTGDVVESGDNWPVPGMNADQRWRTVVSARMGLLMRSQQDGSNEEISVVSYNVAGTNVTRAASDRRIRFVYETQASFRNRSRG